MQDTTASNRSPRNPSRSIDAESAKSTTRTLVPVTPSTSTGETIDRPLERGGRTKHTTSCPRWTRTRSVARPIVPVAPRRQTRWRVSVTVTVDFYRASRARPLRDTMAGFARNRKLLEKRRVPGEANSERVRLLLLSPIRKSSMFSFALGRSCVRGMPALIALCAAAYPMSYARAATPVTPPAPAAAPIYCRRLFV